MTISQKSKLPSESKATSELRGAHRPHFTGVGDKALSNGSRSYSLSKSRGDNGLYLGTEVARKSRGGTLNDRNGGELIGGGTLKARDGERDQDPTNKKPHPQKEKFCFIIHLNPGALKAESNKSNKGIVQGPRLYGLQISGEAIHKQKRP